MIPTCPKILGKEDFFLSGRSLAVIAFILMLLGTFAYFEGIDFGDSLGTGHYHLLNLLRGIQLPATITTLVLTKAAVFFLLWGFLRIFEKMNHTIGGFIGALFLTLSQFVSLNIGRMGVFILFLTVFVWLVTWTESLSFSSRLGLIGFWIGMGFFLISPWVGALLGLIPFLLKKELRFLVRSRWIIRGFFLFLLCFLFLLKFEPVLGRFPGIRAYNIFLSTLGSINDWGGIALFSFSVLVLVWCWPELLLSALICILVILKWMRLDLGGLLMMDVLGSFWLALAFDKIWRSIKGSFRIFSHNFLTIFIGACLFKTSHHELIYKIFSAKDVYKREFKHQAGNEEANPNAFTEKLWVMNMEKEPRKECWAILGNYHWCLPGRYRATFYAGQMDGTDVVADVAQGHGKIILLSKAVPEFSQSVGPGLLPTVVLEYDISQGMFLPVEHRICCRGKGKLFFDRVELKALR